MTIVDLIPHGAVNAISRQKLAEIAEGCGLISHNVRYKDRVMRNMIAEAKKDTVIVALPTGGYFIPTLDDKDYLRTYIAQETSKAINTFKGIKLAEALYEDMIHHRFNHDEIDSKPIQA